METAQLLSALLPAPPRATSLIVSKGQIAQKQEQLTRLGVGFEVEEEE